MPIVVAGVNCMRKVSKKANIFRSADEHPLRNAIFSDSVESSSNLISFNFFLGVMGGGGSPSLCYRPWDFVRYAKKSARDVLKVDRFFDISDRKN